MSGTPKVVAPPLSGILNDLQHLMRNVARFIAIDSAGLSRTVRETAGVMTLAWTAIATGGLLLGFALVHALVALYPGTPVWIGFGVVGLPVLLAGGGLFIAAQSRLESLRPLHVRAVELANETAQIAGHANDAIESTRSSIHKTVGSVQATVNSVKSATDLRHQIEMRPLAMFAGAAGLGYAGGVLLNSNTVGTPRAHPARAATGKDPDTESASEEPGIFAKLGEVLAPQAELAREIAIGAIFSLVRDLARDAVAKPLEQPVDDFFNGAAKRFGGRPLARGTFKSPLNPESTQP